MTSQRVKGREGGMIGVTIQRRREPNEDTMSDFFNGKR
jgi:hypothetical protein